MKLFKNKKTKLNHKNFDFKDSNRYELKIIYLIYYERIGSTTRSKMTQFETMNKTKF